MTSKPTGREKKIADYAWLGKTQRSWKLTIGNPFCATTYTIPFKSYSEEELIKRVKKDQRKEKLRFTKLFPEYAWETFHPLQK